MWWRAGGCSAAAGRPGGCVRALACRREAPRSRVLPINQSHLVCRHRWRGSDSHRSAHGETRVCRQPKVHLQGLQGGVLQPAGLPRPCRVAISPSGRQSGRQHAVQAACAPLRHALCISSAFEYSERAIMSPAMLCSSALQCRPALGHAAGTRRQAARLQPLSVQRSRFVVRAEQQQPTSSSTSEAPEAAAGTPTPPTPPLRSEVAPWDRAPRQIDMAVSRWG